MEQQAALTLTVTGRVQRVGFRRYAQEVARELGLAGWVKNLPDGSVQIHVQGPRSALEAFVERVREAPAPARVKQIVIKEVAPEPGLEHFRIIYGPLEEELQEGFGAMQAIFMEYWREFREFRHEFREFRQEFRDYRQEFRDYRREFQDFRQEFRDHRQEFQNYRQEFRSFAERMEERLDAMNDKLTTILETLVKESMETRRQLTEALNLLRQVVEKLLSGGG